MFKKEQTARQIPQEVKVNLDKGYDGIKKDYPNLKVNIPFKKNRWKKVLTRSEVVFNHKLSSKRILIEHILSGMKKFRVLSEVFRGKTNHYNQDFRNIAALINFRLAYNSS